MSEYRESLSRLGPALVYIYSLPFPNVFPRVSRSSIGHILLLLLIIKG